MNRHFNKWTFFKKKKRRNKDLEELEDIMRFDDKDLDNLIEQLLEEE